MSEEQIKWRLVPITTNSGAMNMAIDEAVSEFVKEGKSLPTIRFYKWFPKTVTIGYFQSLREEVDDNLAKEKGVDIIRRRTGGGAVYHNKEITYSIIAKEDLFPKDLIESYKEICGYIIKGLDFLGIQAEFHPINDVIVEGKKVSGNAQTRRQGVLLQHGTILYDLDVETMFRLLKVPKEKISDKMISDVKQRVACIKDFKDIPESEVLQALIKGFTSNKFYYEEKLSDHEMQRAKELAETKYSTNEWNYLR